MAFPLAVLSGRSAALWAVTMTLLRNRLRDGLRHRLRNKHWSRSRRRRGDEAVAVSVSMLLAAATIAVAMSLRDDHRRRLRHGYRRVAVSPPVSIAVAVSVRDDDWRRLRHGHGRVDVSSTVATVSTSMLTRRGNDGG